MGFYQQSATILRPAKVSTPYNPNDETLTYDESEGATREAIPFGVDMQPRTSVELVDGERVQTQTGWKLFTPPGRDLDVSELERIGYGGRDLDIVGEVQRWPSTDYPSGVDHVSVALEYKNG